MIDDDFLRLSEIEDGQLFVGSGRQFFINDPSWVDDEIGNTEFMHKEHRQREYVEYLVKLASKAVSKIHSWTESLLGDSKFSFSSSWQDQDQFNASVSLPKNSEKFQVNLHLGSIIHAFSISNAACFNGAGPAGNMLTIYGNQIFDKRRKNWKSLEKWDPLNRPLENLRINPVKQDYLDVQDEMVCDAISLLWLHEISHVMGGHLFSKKVKLEKVIRRAAESEADYGSGWLLINFLHSENQGNWSKESQLNAVKRCYRAALVCYLCGSIKNPTNNGRYHLTSTRLVCLLDGIREYSIKSGIDDRTLSSAEAEVSREFDSVLSGMREIFHGIWLPENHPDRIKDLQEYYSTSQEGIIIIDREIDHLGIRITKIKPWKITDL